MNILITKANNYKYATWLKGTLEFLTLSEFLEESRIPDLIIFTGGMDISPIIYGDSPIEKTYMEPKEDVRDLAIYGKALALNIPMLGICRGSQILTAMQPQGELIQDVANHNLGKHSIKTFDGEEFEVTSTHHQMMYPFNIKNHQLIATSLYNISSHYNVGPHKYIDNSKMINTIKALGEPEIVYYPNTRCLAIQAHPEMMDINDPFVNYCRMLVKSLIHDESKPIKVPGKSNLSV